MVVRLARGRRPFPAFHAIHADPRAQKLGLMSSGSSVSTVLVHVTNVPADPRYRAITESVAEKPKRLTPSRASHWLDADEIRRIASGYGVSAAMVEAVIRAESAFYPSAVSPKGARGLMRLISETATALGVKNPFVPRENVEGGVRHLAPTEVLSRSA